MVAVVTDGRLVLFLPFFLIFATIVGDCFPAMNQNNIIMDRKNLSRAAALVAVLVVAGFSVLGIFRHERRQTEVITRLSEEIRVMSHKLNGIAGGPEWPEDTFNYLAIGNSLTLHGITSFWWDNRGMAASETEKDYFHIVSRQLGDRIGKVFSLPYNFSMWEVQAHDRDETLANLDRFLSTKIDMITVQLAENASNLDTYKEDYVSLLKYLKTYCPNARILVVGDFWEKGDRDSLKEQACRECGIEYVSLEGIKGNKDCECGLGTAVFDSEGRPHIVGHEGVAAHPGDSGMAAIAGRILEAFDK